MNTSDEKTTSEASSKKGKKKAKAKAKQKAKPSPSHSNMGAEKSKTPAKQSPSEVVKAIMEESGFCSCSHEKKVGMSPSNIDRNGRTKSPHCGKKIHVKTPSSDGDTRPDISMPDKIVRERFVLELIHHDDESLASYSWVLIVFSMFRHFRKNILIVLE